MVDFVPDDGAEVGVGCFLVFAVADAAVEKVGAIADVALVFIRPFHDAEVGVCGFHGGRSAEWTVDSDQKR